MKTVGVVTTSRADYGLYLPVLREILRYADLKLHLIVGGTHLLKEFGMSVDQIVSDGFEIGTAVHCERSTDDAVGVASAMGVATQKFAAAYAEAKLNILLVLGDRYEMHAAVVAALPFVLPIAHIHGGEVTVGAFDDPLRHSITKLSHIHFTSTDESRARVIQLGEAPWRVTTTGSPAIDNFQQVQLLSRQALEHELQFDLSTSPFLVTLHPTTLDYQNTEFLIGNLLHALEHFSEPIIFTMANADTHGKIINDHIFNFAAARKNALVCKSLGTIKYLSAMHYSSVMIGNSSSGLIEAPSIPLPVVNIGRRQEGRIRAINVIDVDEQTDSILQGITVARSAKFRQKLEGLQNPYGDGHAARRIVEQLRHVALNPELVLKRFYDIPICDQLLTVEKS